MTKARLIKNPIKPTDIGLMVMRTRLSLRETQAEYAKRFHVSVKTVGNWETGRVRDILPIYKAILFRLQEQLQRQGQLMPEDMLLAIVRQEQANSQPATAVAGG